MSEVLQFGPFLIKMQWIVLLVSGVFAYFGIKLWLKNTDLPKEKMMDAVANLPILFIIIWKFSYILFHPISAVKHPLTILFFTGGSKGVWLSVIILFLYLFYRSRKDQISFLHYVEVLFFGILIFNGLYHLLMILIERNLVVAAILQILFSVIIYTIFGWKAPRKNYRHLTQGILWFSMGQIFISYFQGNREAFVWIFSKSQFLFIFIAVIILFIEILLEKNWFFKKS